MGREVVKGRRARRGWQVAACIAVLASPAAAEAPKSPPSSAVLQLGVEPVHERVMDAARRAGSQVAEAYRRSPVMVMGLGLAGALPLLAGLFAVGRAAWRRAAFSGEATLSPAAPTRLRDKPWISVGEGAEAVPVTFEGEILRIGRHSDNDIALEHEAVHRHHALIQRTPDGEFILMDLTAGTGNQPLLNDRPVARAALKDGDRIALGATILTFHLGAEAPAARVQSEPSRPSSSSAREMTNAERDAGDEPAGRAADGIETRRLGPPGRLAARGAHRGRA
ncbi:MAG: FHA domain-containing protein [Hyphomicrobiaceae bacterium]